MPEKVKALARKYNSPQFLASFWAVCTLVLRSFFRKPYMENIDRLITYHVQSRGRDTGRLYNLPLSGQLSQRIVPSPDPLDLHMAIQMEMEKEKIREEILISEIARRRVMRAEVMRGLMSWASAMDGQGLPLPFRPSPRTELVSHTRISQSGERADQIHESFFEERVRMLMDGAQMERHEDVRFEIQGIRKRGLKVTEVEPVCQEKREKLILLGKPDENISRSKRKMTMSAPHFLPSGISNKRAKKDWSCDVCHISCTGQRALDDHLKGRKHKVKEEASLKGNMVGNKYYIGLF